MPELRQIYLVIHDWRLPSFRDEVLRKSTTETLGWAFGIAWPGLTKTEITYDAEPRKGMWAEMRYEGGTPTEQRYQLWKDRYHLQAIVNKVMSRFIEIDAKNRHAQKEAGAIYRHYARQEHVN